MTTKYILTMTLLSTLVFFQACSDKEEKKVEVIKKITQVNINTIKKQNYAIWVNFSGKTQASKNVSITAKVQGELKKILFTPGSKVTQGQALFQVDDSEYKITLLQKEATLNKNKASLKLALANVNRYKPLVQKELAPKEKLDELIAVKEQLQAQITADKAIIKQAKLDLEYTIIKAPIKGSIGKALLDIGNMINTNTVLANIVQSDVLYVNFNPSANEVSLIKKYKAEKYPKIKVIPQNANKNLELYGKLDFIDTISNESTGTVALRASINNTDNILFPGTFVDIKLFISDKIPFIALSPKVISRNQLGAYVYIVNEENSIEIRQLEITYSNKNLVIIKKGLKEGDKVIISAINKLKIAQKVEGIERPNSIDIKGL